MIENVEYRRVTCEICNVNTHTQKHVLLSIVGLRHAKEDSALLRLDFGVSL